MTDRDQPTTEDCRRLLALVRGGWTLLSAVQNRSLPNLPVRAICRRLRADPAFAAQYREAHAVGVRARYWAHRDEQAAATGVGNVDTLK